MMIAVDVGRQELWVQRHWTPWLELCVRYILQLHLECRDEIVAERGKFAQSSSPP